MKCIHKNTLISFVYLGTCVNAQQEILHLIKDKDNKTINALNTVVLTDEEFKINYYLED